MTKIIPGMCLAAIVFTSCVPPASYNRGGWIFNRSDSNAKRVRIVRTAKQYLGARYTYGGTSPRGFDCSGYVMYVYKKNGISLPRSTREQFYRGKRISLGNARPGDLVFFKTSRKGISHVGIYLGNYRFIHAPRTGKRVSYSSIKKKYWKKRYVGTVTYMKGKGHRNTRL